MWNAATWRGLKSPYILVFPPYCSSHHPYISWSLIFRSPSLISVSFPPSFLYLPCHFFFSPCPIHFSVNMKSSVWYPHCISMLNKPEDPASECSARLTFLQALILLYCLPSLPAHTSVPSEERWDGRHTHTHTHPTPVSNTGILVHTLHSILTSMQVDMNNMQRYDTYKCWHTKVIQVFSPSVSHKNIGLKYFSNKYFFWIYFLCI